MSKKKAYEFNTKIIILELEEGWIEYLSEEKQGDDLLTFIKKENGIGSLQISLATEENNSEFDIFEALKRNNQEHIIEIKKYESNGLTVYEYEDINGEFYTRFFNLVKTNTIVLVTYNYTLKTNNKKELSEVIKIVKSIYLSDK
jgi:hypothetical protein